MIGSFARAKIACHDWVLLIRECFQIQPFDGRVHSKVIGELPNVGRVQHREQLCFGSSRRTSGCRRKSHFHHNLQKSGDYKGNIVLQYVAVELQFILALTFFKTKLTYTYINWSAFEMYHLATMYMSVCR